MAGTVRLVTVRKNGLVIDEDGPWTAACYLRTDSQFVGTRHGVHEPGTLCGLALDAVTIVRNPFYGTGEDDCEECSRRLHELAE
jgi:hypothetical protein